MLIYVTGGARSGKSRIAEEKLALFEGPKVYIATAIAFDEGMKDRIAKHRAQRPSEWQTIEMYKDFDNLLTLEAFEMCEAIIFDCATVMITNLMMDSGYDFDTVNRDDINQLELNIMNHVERLLDLCKIKDKDLIVVSNEVGMGLVPAYRMGNIFRDIQGRINQFIATRADEVIFAVSGIPMKLK